MFAAFGGRSRIGSTEGLGPTNATRHGPVADGRAVSAGTTEQASGSTPRRPGAVPVDGPVLMGGGGSELTDVAARVHYPRGGYLTVPDRRGYSWSKLGGRPSVEGCLPWVPSAGGLSLSLLYKLI